MLHEPFSAHTELHAGVHFSKVGSVKGLCQLDYYNAKYLGGEMYEPDIATPAGIKQAYPMHPKAPAHMRWPPKVGVYGDGQGTTAAMAEGGGEDGGSSVRVQWMDTAERCTSPTLPMGGGRERKIDVADVAR